MTTEANNTARARVIDPILTTHAIGYSNGEMIAHEFFPFVDIRTRGAKVIKFGKEAFRKLNTLRAPGAKKQRIQYGYGNKTISLNGHDLEGVVPHEDLEDAATVPEIDLAAGAIGLTLDVILLGLEVEAAALATDPANYSANSKLALSGTDKWSDDASDPENDILEARNQVRRRIGRYPNKMGLGANAFARLVSHPKIKEHFKYTSSESITEAMLAKLFRVDKVVVGAMVFLPEEAGDDQDASDIWPDHAWLAYVPDAGERGHSHRIPSFGYTYRLKGHPLVMNPYNDNPTDSWVYPTKSEHRPYLTGADAGFLFTGVL